MKFPRRSGILRLTRLPDALLPASLLAASLFGEGKPALRLWLSVLSIHLLSLCASHGVRAAFAGQTTVKAVRGSVKSAALLQIVGLLILLFLSYFNSIVSAFLPIPLLIAGFCLNIEHMFNEYLYAISDSHSAAMCHALTALFAFAGLSLDAGGSAHFWTLIAGALSATVSLVISVAPEAGFSGRLHAGVLRCAPRAALQSALYPAIFAAAAAVFNVEPPSVPFFSGLVVYALCRTPFRRTHAESRGMNRLLSALCALSVLVTAISLCLYKSAAPQVLLSTCGAVVVASLCAFIAFGRL